jgi:excisionase family DNA binding protein
MLNTDISLQDVAQMLNVHYMTVYRYVRQGLLPAKKVGRTWFVSTSDLEAFKKARAAELEAPEQGRSRAPWAERLESRLMEGDERGALEVMESVLRAGNDLYYLYLEVLSPALVSIGAQWERGDIEIFVEHRATNIAMRLMSQVGSRFSRRGVSKGTVVMGAPQGEEHAMTVAMIADLVRSEGWMVHDLGSNMPAHSFAEAVRQSNDVVAVCVGVTMTTSVTAARESVMEIRKVLRPGVPIFVGGAGIRNEETVELVGADQWSKDARHLVESLGQLARRR